MKKSAGSIKDGNNNGSKIIKGNSASKPTTPRPKIQPVPTTPKESIK